ncbi:unnamed protein product, partial [Closterium sp. NIES-54]
SLPPLPPSPAPPCLPCIEGRQRAAPHSSSFPPTTAPLQTLHMDVWGPARVSGQSRERYFLLVVDDYTRYTTVFPLRNKGQVVDVLIPWIRTVRLQLRERLGQDLPVLRLHSDRGGEFSSDLLQDFCRGEGILQSFMLPDSPQQNGIAERRIGLVMEVARTSMIHAAAPHFLWPFAVPYAAHQLDLWPRVSLPETSPTLRLTGEVGDASVFWVRGSRAFVRDTFADKLSPRAIPATSRLTNPLPPQGPAPSGVSQVDPLLRPAPVEVAVASGAAQGAASGGAASGGAKTGGAESEGAGYGGAEPGGEEPGSAEPVGVEPEGAEPGGAESEGAESGGAESRVCCFVWSGVTGAGGAGDARAGGAGVTAGAGGPGGTTDTDPTEPRATGAGGTDAGGAGIGGAGAAGAGAVDPGAGGAGDSVLETLYFVPLLQQVLGVPSSTGLTPPLLCPSPDQSQMPLHPASSLPAPSPYTEQSGGLTERREPASRPLWSVCTARRVPRSRSPPVPGTHVMALRPSSVLQGVPLPAPDESSLPEVPDPNSDRTRADSPTSETASPPSIGGERALDTDVLEDRQEDFECLAAAVHRFASMLLAPEGDPDEPDIPTPRSYAEAITGPYSSQWQAPMDAKMASWKSIGTYVDEVPPPGANIADGMWIFKVKRPPGSPPAFKARYVARGFTCTRRSGSLHEEVWLRLPPGFTGSFPAGTQRSLRRPVYGLRQAPREWHDTLRTTLAALGFAPSTADPSLFLRTDTSLPLFYVLVYVNDLVFATADTEALTLVKSELHKRHTCTDLGELNLPRFCKLPTPEPQKRLKRQLSSLKETLTTTVLPCPAAPSGLLSGLHLPSFSTNLVSGADLQDLWVDKFTPGGQRVTHCTCSRTGRHLAKFTHRRGSSLYTLSTAFPLVATSGQVAASGQVFAAASRSCPVSAPCSCRPLAHETLLWHHRLGHPSLPRLRGMASRTLVSGLPQSLPPLPPGPAPTCVPCVEGRQRAAPHSSSFPPTEAPLQTLHMDVWGPAHVHGQGHERYFLLVVDDHSRYTTVFPFRRKGNVTEVLIDWIRGARRQLSENFGSDLPVMRLHSDRGGEFSSDLLRAFCRAEGICQAFTLLASPQQNGIAERCIGMVMDVARTSMIHAAAPHFLWPFAVQYATHQINLQHPFVRDTSADKLSSRAVPCVFLGFPPDAPGWQFYHPTSRRVLSSQDVTSDESVSYYHLFPYRTASLSTPPLFLAPGPARGAEPAGAGTRGVGPGVAVSEGAEPGGAELECVERRGAEPGGAEFGSAEPRGAELERAESGGPPGVPSRREPLSPQQLREWYTLRCRRVAGAGAAGAAGGASRAAGGASGAGAAGGAARARAAGGTDGAGGTGAVGAAGGAGAAGPGGALTGGTGAAGAGCASGVGAAGAGAVVTGGTAGAGAVGVPGAGGAAGVVAGAPGAEGTGAVLGPPPPSLSPPPVQSQSQLQLTSPLPSPSPYSGPTRGLTERREPESRPASPESHSESPVCAVRTGRRVPHQRPPPVLGTHSMTLCPSTAPQRVPLLSPPASSLLDGPDPESDSLRAASPTVTRFLATAVTDPLFESTAASALAAELVDFAVACRLDYATSLVAEFASASVCPPSVGGECAIGTNVLEDRQEELECFATAVPHLVSMLLARGRPRCTRHPDPALLRRGDRGSLLLSVAGSHGRRDGFLEVHRHLL